MELVFNKPESIIIIGAGVAGLSTANDLLKRGKTVTILEACDRLGGRIHTIRNSSFRNPVEKGVEFIHGNLPLTVHLLKAAGIEYTPVSGAMVSVVNGEWKTQEDFAIDWGEIMRKMNTLRSDITLDEFLERDFNDEKHKEVRQSLLRFAQGFDLADTSKASVLALREEWIGGEDEQYRVPGGFDQVVNYLEKQCREAGASIRTLSTVTGIHWRQNDVLIITDKQHYRANKAIITVSLGQLQNNPDIFRPAIPNYLDAARKIGFGSVVKILLEFKKAFWTEKKKNIGFLFTNETIPTWWTQLPSSYPLLTGWAGGPQAWPLENLDDREILETAIQSLSHVFERSIDDLNNLLTASLVANWRNNNPANGAYSYSLVGSTLARKIFKNPIQDTIFFAGEAFYEGPSPGTVEAALVNAKDVVERIMNNE
jgi:monoamine oxidase